MLTDNETTKQSAINARGIEEKEMLSEHGSGKGFIQSGNRVSCRDVGQ